MPATRRSAVPAPPAATPFSRRSSKSGDAAAPARRSTRGKEPLILKPVKMEASVVAADPGGSGGGGLSEYELKRLNQIRENQAMLQSLGLSGGGGLVPQQHAAKPVQRGLQVRAKKRRQSEEGPARRSSRVKGEAADNIYVTSDAKGRITTGGDEAGAAALGLAVTEDPYERQRESRLPEETLTLESTGGTELYGEEFMATLRSLSKAASSNTTKTKSTSTAKSISAAAAATAPLSEDDLGYADRMSRLTIGETGVAKVVPEKIYSCAVHPSSQKLLVAVGDKRGNLGLWDVDATGADSSGVLNWRPHIGVINWLQFDNAGKTLFSSSYDGTVRGMDISTGTFDFVAGVDAGDYDNWLQYGCIGPDGNMVYLADSDGALSCRDRRVKETDVFKIQAHAKKINTISVNPVDQHVVATSSLDRTVRLWDVRALGGGGSKRGGRGGKVATTATSTTPGEFGAVDDEGRLLLHQGELAVLPEPAGRSINGASFSPGGDRLITVSQANQLRLYSNPHKQAFGSTVDPTNSCYHDNKTGRWLAVFHAAWDPKTNHSFAVGSMSQPRQVEIYTTTSNQLRRVMSLQDPDYLGSVQSRNVFHPTQDIVVCCNASGRVHVFR